MKKSDKTKLIKTSALPSSPNNGNVPVNKRKNNKRKKSILIDILNFLIIILSIGLLGIYFIFNYDFPISKYLNHIEQKLSKESINFPLSSCELMICYDFKDSKLAKNQEYKNFIEHNLKEAFNIETKCNLVFIYSSKDKIKNCFLKIRFSKEHNDILPGVKDIPKKCYQCLDKFKYYINRDDVRDVINWLFVGQE